MTAYFGTQYTYFSDRHRTDKRSNNENNLSELIETTAKRAPTRGRPKAIGSWGF